MEHRTNELKFLMDYRIFQSCKVSGRGHGPPVSPGNQGPAPQATTGDNYSMGPGLGGQAQSLPGCRQQIEGIKAGSGKTSSLKQPFQACYSQLKANEPE